jgi:hypothetical protein
MASLRAHFDGKVLVPTEPVDLPTGRLLELEVKEVLLPHFNAKTLAETLERLPRADKCDIDAIENAIEEGQAPIEYDGVFDQDK